MAISLLGLLYLGVRSVDDPGPTVAESVAIVLLAGAFQVFGGTVIARVGRADPTLAQSAVGQIVQLARQTKIARKMVEDAFDSGDSKTMESALGRTSVHLSYLEDGLVLSIQNWKSFHPDALEDVVVTDSSMVDLTVVAR